MDSPEASLFKTNPISLKELLDELKPGRFSCPTFSEVGSGTTTVFADCWPVSPGAFR